MYCLHPIEVRKWQCKDIIKTDAQGKSYIFGSTKSVKTNNYHLVPCGKCVACLSNRRNEWTYRLCMEDRYSDYTRFCTLTYDQEKIPIRIVENKPYFVFDKADVQKYIKRVRYFIHELNKNLQITYYCVSEYGSKGHRPHYHMLLFVKNDKEGKYRKSIDDILRGTWNKGFTTIKAANQANIHYCTKYCIKSLEQLPLDCIDPVFILASKKQYLGAGVSDKLYIQNLDTGSATVFLNGFRQAMPRIYRNKLGLPGLSVQMSDDPRLTTDLYDHYLNEWRKNHKYFNVLEFSAYINSRLAHFERGAIRRQLQRSEKL